MEELLTHQEILHLFVYSLISSSQESMLIDFCTSRNTHAFKNEDPEALHDHPEFLEELGCRG